MNQTVETVTSEASDVNVQTDKTFYTHNALGAWDDFMS